MAAVPWSTSARAAAASASPPTPWPAGSGRAAGRPRLSARQEAVDRCLAAAVDQDDRGEAEREEVVLEALALLGAGPVHEEAEAGVDRDNGPGHDGGDAEGGDPAEG